MKAILEIPEREISFEFENLKIDQFKILLEKPNDEIPFFIEKYTNDDRYLIFASGVSNSKETRESEYLREIELIKKSISEHPDKKFVYFSSSMIITGLETRYFKHKLKIHKLIQ